MHILHNNVLRCEPAGPDNITLGTGHTPETGQTREGVWVVCPAYGGQGYVGSGGREQSRLFECHYLYQWDLGGWAERREGKKPSTELVDWPTSDHLCLFFSPLCCLFCVGGNCKHCLSLSSYVSSFPHPPHHCNSHPPHRCNHHQSSHSTSSLSYNTSPTL